MAEGNGRKKQKPNIPADLPGDRAEKLENTAGPWLAQLGWTLACSAGLALGCGSDPAASFPLLSEEQLSSVLQHMDLDL